MTHTPDIGLLRPLGAEVCAQVTALVNEVYLDTEGPLWIPGAERTSASEVADAAAAGLLHGLLDDAGAPLGVVRVEVGGVRAELGMLAVAPSAGGRRIGTALVRHAEAHARARGATLMGLVVARPREGILPAKEWLGVWYSRLGYARVDTVTLEELYPDLVPSFAVPTLLDLYERPL